MTVRISDADDWGEDRDVESSLKMFMTKICSVLSGGYWKLRAGNDETPGTRGLASCGFFTTRTAWKR